MGIRTIIAGLCLLATSGTALSATPEEIGNWIRDLNHPRYRIREAATASLEAAGTDAIAPLLIEARHGSGESTVRALTVLDRFANGTVEARRDAARSGLKRLAEVDGTVGTQAKQILRKARNQARAILLEKGAEFQRFDTNRLEIDFSGVKDFAAVLPHLIEFPELTGLRFNGNQRLLDDHAKHLKPLEQLETLDLYQSSIGNDALPAIAKLSRLQSLMLGSTKVTDAGLPALGTMKSLRYLGLRANPITDDALKHLAGLTDLEGLNLGETRVTDAGVVHLKPLRSLETLYLHETATTDKSFEVLAELKSLKVLYLGKTGPTAEGRKRFAEARPDVRIIDFER
jgi:hypothetical protein